MEPDIIPLHSSSPPPLDDDSDGEAGSEEDEFGDFGGFSVKVSCSPPGFAGSTDSLSSLRQPSTTIKPATHQSNCSFNLSVEQSQPTSTVDSGSVRGQIFVEGQDCNAKSYVHLSNGFPERDHNSKIHIASAEPACSPREETGFADFTVFTEQAAHPWCCGFSPMGSKEKWVDTGGERTNSSNSLGDQICDPGQDVVMDSEPRSHEQENVCTKVQHCEKRDAALVQPSQNHHPPQEAAAALDFPSGETHSGEDDIGKHGDSQRERRHSFSSLQTTEVHEDEELDEDGEKSISAVPQTFSVYESASEDLASFCDDLSFEGVSADLEPNVSSLVSHDGQTDCDQTDDDEEEDLGNDNTACLRQSEAEKRFHYCVQSATQETSATSNHSQPGTHTEDSFADFRDCSFEHHRDQPNDALVLSLGNLPPSDSFADFCSAPTQEDGEESWAEFKDQRAQEEDKTWTHFREPVSILLTDGDTREEKDRAEQYGVSRRNNSQDSLPCRVQQLLLASFPQVDFPAVEGEEEVLSLGALLHAQRLLESEEEEELPELCPRTQWIRRGVWWPHQDLHDAVGLQFQWGGSYTNRTLLRCLGVETRNIVFIGTKKHPVAVPAFASSLGMLQPTKDSVPAVCSPGHAAITTTQAPPEPRDTPDPSTDSMQEALPSSQLDWSRRGLSSSQDDCSALNLDYFGPEEESRSYGSSSRSNSPPPGVDPELYELTISKLETGASSSHMEDTLNRLMSTAEKTSTSVRKPQPDEELSVEAGRLIAGLPNLYFMQAKVLMFPSILLPKECCSLK